jgi:hypothetical protein
MEQSLMSGVPAALTIWLVLLGSSALALAILAAIAGHTRVDKATRKHRAAPPAYVPRTDITRQALAIAKEQPPEPPKAPVVTKAPDPRPETTALDDDRRFAEEIATAAVRAGVTADRRHSAWVCAQRAVEAAWQAYESADGAARRAIRAAAFPTPAADLTPAEHTVRERHLHRLAQAAHARGELSTDQLIDAMSHRNGFDPRLHPIEQDAMLRRIARDRLLRVYITASDHERSAWREADIAMAAKRSLDREAAAAARRVRQAQQHPASAQRPGHLVRWITAVRPSLAVR